MAEIAGLALGAVGVAALFTTCIEALNIVTAAQDFSEDYELQCTQLALQRIRFALWGESVGLVPDEDGRKLPFNEGFKRPHIHESVERTLASICLLLEKTDAVSGRYDGVHTTDVAPSTTDVAPLTTDVASLTTDVAPLTTDVASLTTDVAPSRGMNLFRESFDHFRYRLRKSQTTTSALKKTRWAIHDSKKLQHLVTHLRDSVDALESITSALVGIQERQHELLCQEIDTLSDVASLRLLRDASSSQYSGSIRKDISDTVSQRLNNVVAASIAEAATIRTASDTYYTAKSEISSSGRIPSIPGAFPRPFHVRLPGPDSGVRFPRTSKQSGKRQDSQNLDIRCPRCDLEFVSVDPSSSEPAICHQCLTNGDSVLVSSSDPPSIPQNQRLIASMLERNQSPTPLSFAAGDSEYGKRLTLIKVSDEKSWAEKSIKLIKAADGSTSAAKRMFVELRNIRQSNVPFISAVAVNDDLEKILASIEGPPETPYEGGVFWITIKLPSTGSTGIPLIRFHTRIYHPNIDCRGNFCADYHSRWEHNFYNGWNLGHSVSGWSLYAILVAICGLLASPDIDDPLVPEIAQKYLEDYSGYCEDAKRYTWLYATGDRPDESNLLFAEEATRSDSDHDAGSIQHIASHLEADMWDKKSTSTSMISEISEDIWIEDIWPERTPPPSALERSWRPPSPIRKHHERKLSDTPDAQPNQTPPSPAPTSLRASILNYLRSSDTASSASSLGTTRIRSSGLFTQYPGYQTPPGPPPSLLKPGPLPLEPNAFSLELRARIARVLDDEGLALAPEPPAPAWATTSLVEKMRLKWQVRGR